MKGGTNDPVSGEVVLYPAMSLYVNLTLDARTGGQEKSLLIFVFDGFKIGRYVKAEVADPMVSLVQRGVVYERGARQGNSRYRETVDKKSAAWTVPGQRPNRNKKTVQYPHRLARYEVPADLREAALYPEDLPKFAPVLTERLSSSNYRERFKLLLHLEEIQMDVDIREFDLHRVCLRQVGEYLGLQVPGLAEGRPSVLIGDSVYLTDPGDPEGPCFEGFVHETMKDEVLLKFNPEFHRSYTGKDFNVVFTFNRGQLRKCHKATEMAETLEENVLFPSYLQPRPAVSLSKPGPMHGSSSSNTGNRSALMFMNQRLNTRQRAAVNRIVQGQSRPLPYILFGPPGTGKTVTVVEAILQVFTRIPSSRIIACTPSNSAADLIAERLHGSGLLKPGDMVRLNAWQRRDETIPECILPYCRVGDDLDIASRYRILVSTCVSLGTLYSLGIQAGHFTHIFIDEAGQATEPEAMIAACMVAQTDGQVILAGDPQQLGPVLRSHAAKEYGLGVSLLERLMCSPLYERNEKKFADHGSYDPLLVTKLVDNYRSHSAILHLPSRLFYHDELVVKADLSVTHTLIEWAELPTKGQPVIFHGVRGEDLREGNSPSWFNPGETVQVVRYLQALLNSSKVTCDDIGVITPYRKQVEKIRLLMEKLSMESVKVGSVEEFQGQERPVIIISTVRSNEDLVGFDERHTLGFLSNPKRFNVAITRAQALLVVIGNPHVLVQDEYWRQLIEYCVDQGMYRGCELPSTALGL
ncbi:RNA helicase Mov10l1-like isoform X2 [Dreissena polymorpha]|nr:RNA helicase Mov10l1-like isoform X2 [Dreissena polymorpha]